ncbi:Hypothetical protein CINCED_3A006458 [Cinara cedri]|uniref:Uncharacterized protein n=1 Tax=Cinara cedri TaxID=506608 RepID=A0A5E4M9H4_9HEMI|nr:Hypothetical protein CINCED_3A006458 [Cinara cedri]
MYSPDFQFSDFYGYPDKVLGSSRSQDINSINSSVTNKEKSKTLLYVSYLRPIKGFEKNFWPGVQSRPRNIREAEKRKFIPIVWKTNDINVYKTKRMERFGHIWRAEDDILKKVTTATIQKKRPLGRPRTRWKDAVKRDIQLLDVNASLELALNRESWKDLLVAAQVLQGPLS